MIFIYIYLIIKLISLNEEIISDLNILYSPNIDSDSYKNNVDIKTKIIESNDDYNDKLFNTTQQNNIIYKNEVYDTISTEGDSIDIDNNKHISNHLRNQNREYLPYEKKEDKSSKIKSLKKLTKKAMSIFF